MSLFREDFIGDILNMVAEDLRQAGIAFPDTVAKRVKRRVQKTWGGSRPYIQHDKEAVRQERDARILAEFHGGERDLESLAKCHGISTRQARRIITK